MTYLEFKNKIANLHLCITIYRDDLWAIGYKEIANPMLFFNPLTEERDYTGNITVKSINMGIFNADELKQSITLVNELLLTKMEDRGERFI